MVNGLSNTIFTAILQRTFEQNLRAKIIDRLTTIKPNIEKDSKNCPHFGASFHNNLTVVGERGVLVVKAVVVVVVVVETWRLGPLEKGFPSKR